MLLNVLKSKLHRVTVTQNNLDYEGSCAIDASFMGAANISPYEQIHIYNVNNGERFSTYAIPSNNPGEIDVRGSAARKAMPGDILIICTYGMVSEIPQDYKPIEVFFGSANNITWVS